MGINRLWLEDDTGRGTFGATIRTKEIDSGVLDRDMPVKVVVPKGAPANDGGLVGLAPRARRGRDELPRRPDAQGAE